MGDDDFRKQMNEERRADRLVVLMLVLNAAMVALLIWGLLFT